MPYAKAMADIYTRLRDVGLDRRFVLGAALPGNWYDSRARRPDGRAEAESSVAGALGIPVERLADPEACLLLPAQPEVVVANTGSVAPDRLSPTLLVARRAAELAVRALARPRPAWLEGMEPLPLREYIIGERRLVRLRSLVDTAYGLGVPVIPLLRTPAAGAPLDAIVVPAGNTPVVVLGSRLRAPAWVLSHLAHALAHVALGHAREGLAVDAELLGSIPDEREAAAEQFAQTLIHGRDDLYVEGHDRITAVKLATLARQLSQEHGLEVGAVVVRFAFAKAAEGRWARAPAARALKELGVSDGGPAVLVDAMERALDLRLLSCAERRFLCFVTGAGDGLA